MGSSAGAIFSGRMQRQKLQVWSMYGGIYPRACFQVFLPAPVGSKLLIDACDAGADEALNGIATGDCGAFTIAYEPGRR